MTDAAAASDETALIGADGTNARPLYCRHCGCQFLSAEKAERVDHERSGEHLRRITAGGGGGDGDGPAVSSSFWKIPDMWDFDNFGQTRKVPSSVVDSDPSRGATPETVYVVCSDCERGPVGVRWAEGEPYYVSLGLVRYDKPDGAPEDGALPPGMSEAFVRGLIAQKEAAEAQAKEAEAEAEDAKEQD
mmetsp:Transcript_29114/g.86186  ORF Transcript_29114/g.86186 Transcript_29114/m.86186 type:complete len:189 (-) Transcript_29114:364-930(-)